MRTPWRIHEFDQEFEDEQSGGDRHDAEKRR
jgi:hypothetical protein